MKLMLPRQTIQESSATEFREILKSNGIDYDLPWTLEDAIGKQGKPDPMMVIITQERKTRVKDADTVQEEPAPSGV